jgi:hypothetical protein
VSSRRTKNRIKRVSPGQNRGFRAIDTPLTTLSDRDLEKAPENFRQFAATPLRGY